MDRVQGCPSHFLEAPALEGPSPALHVPAQLGVLSGSSTLAGSPSLGNKTRGQRTSAATSGVLATSSLPASCSEILASLWGECSSPFPIRPLILGFRKQRARESEC